MSERVFTEWSGIEDLLEARRDHVDVVRLRDKAIGGFRDALGGLFSEGLEVLQRDIKEICFTRHEGDADRPPGFSPLGRLFGFNVDCFIQIEGYVSE